MTNRNKASRQPGRASIWLFVLLLAIIGASLYYTPVLQRYFAPKPSPAPAPAPAPTPVAVPASPVPASPAMPADIHARVELFTRHGWGFPVGESRTEILRTLGQPIREKQQAIDNIYAPRQKDRLYTLIYDGLTVMTHHVTHTKREFLIDVTVTDPRYRTIWGLDVGCPAATVTKILGKPGKSKTNELYYEDESGYSWVVFSIKDGKVAKIEWAAMVD